MATSIQPDPNSSNPQDQNIQIPDPQSQQQNQNQIQQPTNPAAFSSEMLREVLQDNNRLRQQLATQPQVTQPNNQVSPEDYWRDPVGNNRNLIRDEITQSIRPLYEDVARMRREAAYSQLKLNARATVQNFNLVEAIVDQAMANLEPTAFNMDAAVNYAFGQLYRSGQLNLAAPANPQVRPPNVPPSAPPAPNNLPNNAQVEQLSEYDLRMMREAGIKTPEEYIKWRDMPFNQISPQ